MKKCIHCSEKIQDEAKKCKHCGEWLEKEKLLPNQNLEKKQKVHFLFRWYIAIPLCFFFYSLANIFNNSTRVGADLEATFNILGLVFLVVGIINIFKRNIKTKHKSFRFKK